MGIFNKNKGNTDNELISILGEIRDNLQINNNNIVTELESKIADAHYSNDEELGVMVNRLNKLEDKIEKLTTLTELQDKTINKLEDLVKKQDESISVLIKSNKVVLGILSDVVKPKKQNNTVKPKVKKVKGNVINAYGRNWKSYNQINLNNITKLDENGNFLRKGRGKQMYTWNIKTLLKLREYMKDYDKYPSQEKLAKAIGVNPTSLIELGYYILNGDFDKYFNEWEQIQMNKTYGNWKPILENNPEKRKEKGYC